MQQQPPMMDEDPMAVMSPDVGGDMDFPQGDMDYEMQDQRLAQPQLVHSTPEMQAEYKRMGMRPTPEATDLTQGYESAPQGSPIREKFHAAQHQRMKGDQNSVNQQLRMQLAQKKAMLEAKMLQMQRAGDLKGAQRLQQVLQGLAGQIDSAMSGMEQP